MTPHPIEAAKQRRIQYDTDNAAWLLPLREAFHAYLVDAQGYLRQQTPPPGCSYPGSHAQTLWECWLAATLCERARSPGHYSG
jgi:hypothetical protein